MLDSKPRTREQNLAIRRRSSAPGKAVLRDKDSATLAILSAAEVEFSRFGLQAARTDAIAKTAGVAKGLIFHYYGTKERLYEAVLERAYHPLQEAIEASGSLSISPALLLEALVSRLLQTVETHPLIPSIMLLESIQNGGEHYRRLGFPSLFKMIERVLEQGISAGCFRQMDCSHAAINIMGLCTYYYAAANNFTDPKPSKGPFAKQALQRQREEAVRFIQASVAL